MAVIRSRRARSNLGAGIFESVGTEGFGAKLFEWWNPDQVRAEYEAVGQTPPPPTSFDDVLEAAYGQARESAQEAHRQLTSGLKLAGVALAIGAALYAWNLATRGKRRK